jgi:Uma2 family endonuclease
MTAETAEQAATTTADPTGMFTAADLLDTPDDGRRYEVLEGALVVSPYARLIHQRWVRLVEDALRSGEPDGVEVLAGANIDAGTDAPVPDVLVVASRVVDADAVSAEPRDVRVVVEVLSPGQHGRDRLLKRDIYARIGIPVYWIVDPATATVLVLRLDGDAYTESYAGTDLAEAARTTWEN